MWPGSASQEDHLCPLTASLCDRCVHVLETIGPAWANICESQIATYLGYAVGPLLPQGVWDKVSLKIAHRTPTVRDLGVGAPALLFLAKGLLWACASHQLAMYSADASLAQAFRSAQSSLLRGPPGWMNHGVSINLKELGWSHPPIDVRELEVKQLSFILRKLDHPFVRRFMEIREAVFSDEAPLKPFLGGWAMHGAYASLNAIIEQAVRHNVFSVGSSHMLRVCSGLRDIQSSRKAFLKMLATWLSCPDEPRACASHIVWSWLHKRLVRTWGDSVVSYRFVCRVRDYLISIGKQCPPRHHNAALRLLTGGVHLYSIEEEAFERHCLLVRGCLGENSLDHYARSACWHHHSLACNVRPSLSLFAILGTPVTRARARALGSLAYLLVKALNWARSVRCEYRPLNCVLHCARYR